MITPKKFNELSRKKKRLKTETILRRKFQSKIGGEKNEVINSLCLPYGEDCSVLIRFSTES
jgi:hypothetical protein